jgi:hypothetical protein
MGIEVMFALRITKRWCWRRRSSSDDTKSTGRNTWAWCSNMRVQTTALDPGTRRALPPPVDLSISFRCAAAVIQAALLDTLSSPARAGWADLMGDAPKQWAACYLKQACPTCAMLPSYSDRGAFCD